MGLEISLVWYVHGLLIGWLCVMVAQYVVIDQRHDRERKPTMVRDSMTSALVKGQRSVAFVRG